MAKMWKYISRASKVVNKKKNETVLNAVSDKREYAKISSRTFSMKWKVGQPWLKYDEEKGMILWVVCWQI